MASTPNPPKKTATAPEPLNATTFAARVQDPFKDWVTSAQQSAKIIDAQADALFNQSKALGAAARGIDSIARQRREAQENVKFLYSKAVALPLGVLGAPAIATGLAINEGTQAVRAKRQQAVRDNLLITRNQTATAFLTAVQNDYQTKINELKTVYDDAKEAIKNDNTLPDDAARDAKLKDLDNAYNGAKDNYERWQRDRLAAGERICNQAGKILLATQNKNPDFANNGLQIDESLLPPNPFKHGDTLTLDLKVKKVNPSGKEQEPYDVWWSPVTPEPYHQIQATVEAGRNGAKTVVLDLKDLATSTYMPFFGDPIKLSIHSGPTVRLAYIQAFQQILSRDPNTTIDIDKAIKQFPTTEERQQFVAEMVSKFGNISMGIEHNPIYNVWKNEAVERYGVGVQFGLTGPAQGLSVATTPPNIPPPNLAASTSPIPAPTTTPAITIEAPRKGM